MNKKLQLAKGTKAKSSKHYNWTVTPDIYIATALLLAEQMLLNAGLHNEVAFDSDILKRLGLRSAHPDYELILPLVFNFKHGIELYIKSLGIVDYGEYIKKHDFKILFDELKKGAKRTVNEATINRLYTDTWDIIKKYYYGRYIPLNKGSKFADTENEAERYPEYKSRKTYGKIYQIPDPYEWVTRAVLEEVQNDIKLIESKFVQAKRDIKPTKKFIYGRTH